MTGLSARNEKTPRPRFYQRKYVVDRNLQFGIVGFFFSLAVITIGVFCIAYFVVLSDLRQNIGIVDDAARRFLELGIANLNDRVVLHLVGFSLSILAYFVVGGILLSHRIAGPVHRIRTHLRAVADKKNPPALKFRRHDYLKDLAEDINRVTDKKS
ncbi:MAG: hypothetical protein A2428_07810 [Bdellovibrionales bacterium RIFOXYC1_FULL_54_43]|nr:MAG: hypothetical protein A2428_07810 [Bdellovibrionales bacterium RIFOXYC1_FULL_54_43]OFZ79034.1 MAG: hypothetical protein A2603_10120 [Bdellovibrionales bacterium RIFOXYD1_FULL_55_31]